MLHVVHLCQINFFTYYLIVPVIIILLIFQLKKIELSFIDLFNPLVDFTIMRKKILTLLATLLLILLTYTSINWHELYNELVISEINGKIELPKNYQLEGYTVRISWYCGTHRGIWSTGKCPKGSSGEFFAKIDSDGHFKIPAIRKTIFSYFKLSYSAFFEIYKNDKRELFLILNNNPNESHYHKFYSHINNLKLINIPKSSIYIEAYAKHRDEEIEFGKIKERFKDHGSYNFFSALEIQFDSAIGSRNSAAPYINGRKRTYTGIKLSENGVYEIPEQEILFVNIKEDDKVTYNFSVYADIYLPTGYTFTGFKKKYKLSSTVNLTQKNIVPEKLLKPVTLYIDIDDSIENNN